MSMRIWSPLREMESLLDRYNRFPGRSLTEDSTSLTLPDWSPSVDIDEEEKRFLVKAEMPGVKKEDVSVELKEGILTIHGEKRAEKKEEGDNKRHQAECFYGSFTRSFTLPDGPKAEEIDASYKDGILELSIPKHEAVKKLPEATTITIH